MLGSITNPKALSIKLMQLRIRSFSYTARKHIPVVYNSMTLWWNNLALFELRPLPTEFRFQAKQENYLQIQEYVAPIPNIPNKARDRSLVAHEKPAHDIGREWGK